MFLKAQSSLLFHIWSKMSLMTQAKYHCCLVNELYFSTKVSCVYSMMLITANRSIPKPDVHTEAWLLAQLKSSVEHWSPFYIVMIFLCFIVEVVNDSTVIRCYFVSWNKASISFKLNAMEKYSVHFNFHKEFVYNW